MSADLLASQLVCCQVLWELLTHEVPFRGLEGLAVAWLVVGRGVVSGATLEWCTILYGLV